MEDKQLVITPTVARYKEVQGTVDPIKVAEMLGEPLHVIQAEIAKYFTKPYIDNYGTFVFLMARRLGKSFLIKKIIVAQLLTPESSIFLASHSTSLSDEHFQNIYRDLMKIPAIASKVVARKKEGILEIPELNTRLICASYLNAESRFVGKNSNFFCVDESFLIPPEYQQALYDFISPTLTTWGYTDEGVPRGKLILLSTPRGTATGSWSGRTFLRGMDREKGFISWKATIEQSPFLSTKEIESIRQETSKESWLTEYMCEFSSSTRTVFPHFNTDKHIISLTTEQLKDMAGHCELMYGIDIAMGDGNAFSAVIYNNKRKTYYIIDEHYAKGELVRDFGRTLRDNAAYWSKTLNIPYQSIQYYCDPSALSARVELSKDYDLTIHKAKNAKAGGVEYLNQLLQGKGDASIPQLYFRDNCTIHAKMFLYAEWKLIGGIISNQFAKDPSELDSHFDLCDSAYYAIYSHYKNTQGSVIVI